ncbi:MAG: secretion protein HlyD [Gammaproteobacteria bacterium]|jgi:HlyD family secretion protein|nr:secretion protein HlyD [Gammaproteobacteria bacterium]
MGKKLRLIFLISLLGIGSALVFFYFYRENHRSQDIILHGNVDIRQVDLGFRLTGRVQEMKFEEGDKIKKGDIIASLDKTPFIFEVNNLKGLADVAKANLTKLHAGNRPQEIQEAKALVREREVSYDNAQKVLNRQTELVKKNYASKQEYDDAFAKAKETQAQLKTAEEALKLAVEGFRSEDIAAGLAQLEAVNSQLATAQNNLNDTDLLAPNDGIILTRIREPGSIVNVGSPVYTLSLINPVWIRAYTSEINLGHLKPGMKALVYTDTFPKQPYQGQIGFISPVAEFTPKNVETKELRTDLVYRLRVIVEDKEGQLRQGMPVTVVIAKEPHE